MKTHWLRTAGCWIFFLAVCVHGFAEAEEKKGGTAGRGKSVEKEEFKAPSGSLKALVVEVNGMTLAIYGEKKIVPRPGLLLPEKTWLRTETVSHLIFRTMPGVTLFEAQGTGLGIERIGLLKEKEKILGRQSYVYMKKGAVFSSLKKFNAWTTDYKVRTPQAVVAARGTEFWVIYDEDRQEGTVGVWDGVVEVELVSGKSKRLIRGQYVDILGIGPKAQFKDLREPTVEERRQTAFAQERIAKTSDYADEKNNPFFAILNREETKSGVDFELAEQQAAAAEAVPALVPNPANVPVVGTGVSPTWGDLLSDSYLFPWDSNPAFGDQSGGQPVAGPFSGPWPWFNPMPLVVPPAGWTAGGAGPQVSDPAPIGQPPAMPAWNGAWGAKPAWWP